MMDLTHTTGVEHADSQADGCAWHGDPACLCDVVVTDPIGDVCITQPWLEDLFTQDASTDEWFFKAFDIMVGRTVLASMLTKDTIGAQQLLNLLDNEALVQDLLDGMGVPLVVEKYGKHRDAIQALRKYLNLRTHGLKADGTRNYHVRQHVMGRVMDGERIIDIYEDMQARGITGCTKTAAYQWASRARREAAA
jgi:hypothetical protein